MAGRYIENNAPKKGRYVSKDAVEEENYTSEFRTLTDLIDPVDMYNRNIITEANGGQNVISEHIERLSRLIEARGNYVTLVKRIVDGDWCSCYNSITKEVRRKYCLECYGTRITGGYKRYNNQNREDGKIIIARPFNDEQITWEEWGRDWKDEQQYWTLPWIPLELGRTLFSYDFFIQYNNDGTELGRYYITAVKPSRSIKNEITYQYFSARLADRPTYDTDGNIIRRGDVIYEISPDKLEVINGGNIHG